MSEEEFPSGLRGSSGEETEIRLLAALDELGSLDGPGIDVTEIARRAMHILKEGLGLVHAGLLEVDLARGEINGLVSLSDFPSGGLYRAPVTKGVLGRAVRTGIPVWVPDVSKDSDYVPFLPSIGSELAIPVRGGGRLIAVLDFESRAPEQLAPRIPLLQLAASRLGIALNNARLVAEKEAALMHSREDAARLEVLNEVARLATLGGELRTTLDAVTRTLASRFGWEFVAVVSIDRARGHFVCEAVTSSHITDVFPGYSRPLGSGVVGEVAETGISILLDDVRGRANFVETLAGTMSELCVPVLHEGEVIAAINLESRRLAAFTDQLGLVETVARQVGGAINLASMNRRLTEANERLVEMNRRLEDANETITKLMAAPLTTSETLGTWSRGLAGEVTSLLGLSELAIFEVSRGTVTRILGTNIRTPDLQHLHPHASKEVVELAGGDLGFVIRGAGGETLGLLVAGGANRSLPVPAIRLLEGVARQVGGALEVKRTREQLAAAEARRGTRRREIGEGQGPALGVCRACGTCSPVESGRCPLCESGLDEFWLLPLTLCGRYELLRFLGSGGMGSVFRARDRKLQRDVAIKLIRPEHFGNPEIRFRFEREAQAVARIRHPAVVAVFDSGELPEGWAYMVMELLRGFDLGSLLEAAGPGTPAEIARLLRQGAAGLEAAHAAGVIHRDVKPSNVFIVPSKDTFSVKIFDFGLAAVLDHHTRITLTGMVVGTPAYMSPEQVQGLPLDRRSDLYSFAAVAYEALTGVRAIPGDDLARIMANVLDYTPRPVSWLVPGTPPEIDLAFSQALAKECRNRPEDLAAWAETSAGTLEGIHRPVPGWHDALNGKHLTSIGSP